MADITPPPLAHRIAYELDPGITPFMIQSSVLTQYDQDLAREMNSDLKQDIGEFFLSQFDPGKFFGLVFERPMDIDFFSISGITASFSAGWSTDMWYSEDTHDGQNGTWVSTGTSYSPVRQHDPEPIRDRAPVTIRNAIGVRWFNPSPGAVEQHRVGVVHLWGRPSSTIQSLRLWHPTENRGLRADEFWPGNVHLKSGHLVYFRVKNVSASDVANDIDLSFQNPNDEHPGVFEGYTMRSLESDTYSQEMNIGTLNAGEISDVYVIRILTPFSIPDLPDYTSREDLHAVRLMALPQSWS